WSPVYTTVNKPQTNGKLRALDTVSDVWDKTGRGSAHLLTPAFAWSPSAPAPSPVVPVLGSSLYRVYIFSDKNCVNRIFTGSVVGSPAWAPRSIGGGTPSPPQGWNSTVPSSTTSTTSSGSPSTSGSSTPAPSSTSGSGSSAAPSSGSPTASTPSTS